MDIAPKIPERTTQELFDIVETGENWREDVVILARAELQKRGFSPELQEIRRKSRTKFQKRIEAIKARATFTPLEKLLIFLFGPVLFIIFFDIFWFYKEGHRKKNIEGLMFLLSGVGFWTVILLIVLNNS